METPGWGGVEWGGVDFFLEVAFLEDPSNKVVQDHSHEIRLKKLVWTLILPYYFAITRSQNIEKL